jgi:hypothetical protein
MPRIEKDQLIGGLANIEPETIVLLNWFYATFDNVPVGTNRRITNVEFVHSMLILAGSEFATYAATKLYVALNLYISGSETTNAALSSIRVYNEANALAFSGFANNVVHYTGAVQVANFNSYLVKNIYFSRLQAVTFSPYLIFTGFRFTLA